jgi:hypothetical protein
LPVVFGIEILCIMAAEIGENIGLYTFGFNLKGIALIRYRICSCRFYYFYDYIRTIYWNWIKN